MDILVYNSQILLTEEQYKKEDAYLDAVILLNDNGFMASYVPTIVNSPKDEPGYITLI